MLLSDLPDDWFSGLWVREMELRGVIPRVVYKDMLWSTFNVTEWRLEHPDPIEELQTQVWQWPYNGESPPGPRARHAPALAFNRCSLALQPRDGFPEPTRTSTTSSRT